MENIKLPMLNVYNYCLAGNTLVLYVSIGSLVVCVIYLQTIKYKFEILPFELRFFLSLLNFIHDLPAVLIPILADQTLNDSPFYSNNGMLYILLLTFLINLIKQDLMVIKSSPGLIVKLIYSGMV